MGTSYSVKIVGIPKDAEAHQLQADVDGALKQVNDRMSTYNGTSELSRFNQNRSTDWIRVSSSLLTVVHEALRVSHLSAGAFDITVGPLVNLWGFGPDPRRSEVPSDAQIQTAVANVGYDRLQVRDSPPAIRKDDPDVYLDFSAIAKGYGVDQVAVYLESRGL
jgi:thiamine biosynthesis lipoprotein